MILDSWKYLFSTFKTLENVGQFLLWLLLVVMAIPLSFLIPIELLFSLPLPWSNKGGD